MFASIKYTPAEAKALPSAGGTGSCDQVLDHNAADCIVGHKQKHICCVVSLTATCLHRGTVH